MNQQSLSPLRHIPYQMILATMQIMLGVSALLGSTAAGSSYAFIENHLPIPIWFIGGSFMISGITIAFTTNWWLYFFASFLLLVIGIIALFGSLYEEVPLQSAIIYFGLFTLALRAYGENGHG